jgi:hypothetical protein
MARIRQAQARQAASASPRDVIAAILAEALPADDERRTFTVVNTAYFALSLTDPALAIAPLVKNSRRRHRRDRRPAAHRPGRRRHARRLDPDRRPSACWPCPRAWHERPGGQSSVEQAQAVIDYHLDRGWRSSESSPVTRLTAAMTSRAAW